MLKDHGMPADDSQLRGKSGLPDGGLSYLDFVAVLEGKGILTAPNYEANVL